MSHYYCWTCRSMVDLNANQTCSSCGSEFIEECSSGQPPIDDNEPTFDLDHPPFGPTRVRGTVGDRAHGRHRYPHIDRPDFPNSGATNGSRPAAAANSSRSSHGRHHLNIQMRDGSGQTQTMQFDQNDPSMLLQQLMGNMFHGTGMRVMLGDQMFGAPGDYVGSERSFDRLISSLMNEMERGSGPPAATQDAINHLPDATITEEQVRQSLQCSICFENFTLGERVKALPCAHIYHKECIEKWLNMHGTCPVCRKTLGGHDTSFSEHRDEASGGDGGGGGGGAAAASSSHSSRATGSQAGTSRHAGASSSTSSRHGATGGGGRGGGNQPGGRRHHRSHSDSDSMHELWEEVPQEQVEAADHSYVDLRSSSPVYIEDHFEDAEDHNYFSPVAAVIENEDSNASLSSVLAERSSPVPIQSSADSSPVRRTSRFDDSSTNATAPAARTRTNEDPNDASVIIVDESPAVKAPVTQASSSTSAPARSGRQLQQPRLDSFLSSNYAPNANSTGASRRVIGSSSSTASRSGAMDWDSMPSSSTSSSTSRPAGDRPPRNGSGSKKSGRERTESKDEELGFHRHSSTHNAIIVPDDEVQMTETYRPANSVNPQRLQSNPKRAGAVPPSTGPTSAFASSTTSTSRARNGTADHWTSMSSNVAASNRAANATNHVDLD